MKRILIFGGIGLALLVVLCMVLGIIGALVSPSETNVEAARLSGETLTNANDEAVSDPTATSEPASAPEPTDTPPPTDTPEPVPELLFADIVQHPNERNWTTTQYNTYLDTIKKRTINNWSGIVLEVKEFGGRPYLSLDMEQGEPEIDAYVYIAESDVLKVGLGQQVTFNGTTDAPWSEDNGFKSLQIEDVTLVEFGEIPLPTSTSTPTNTNTPLPPTATSTPAPPTATPTPRPPTATVEPRVEIPLEVQLYGIEVGQEAGVNLAGAMGKISELLLNQRIGDENWTIDVALQMTIIRLAHQSLTQIQPPAEMAEVHRILLDATQDCNDAMDYLTSGIDNLNVSDIEQATALMESCGNKTNNATVLLNDYLAQFE